MCHYFHMVKIISFIHTVTDDYILAKQLRLFSVCIDFVRINISENNQLICSFLFFLQTKLEFQKQLSEDPIVKSHLATLYDNLLEQNLCRIIEPFSRVQVSCYFRSTIFGTIYSLNFQGNAQVIFLLQTLHPV